MEDTECAFNLALFYLVSVCFLGSSGQPCSQPPHSSSAKAVRSFQRYLLFLYLLLGDVWSAESLTLQAVQ